MSGIEKQSKFRVLIGRFAWWLIPMWLAELVRRRTGYVMGKTVMNGKMIAFYFQRQKPLEFSSKTWNGHADLGKVPLEIAEAMYTIRKYLKLHNLLQVMVDVGGGAVFRRTSIYEDFPQATIELTGSQPKDTPPKIIFTFDERSLVTDEAEVALLKLPPCTCGYGSGPSPAHRGDCPMRIWE